MRQLDSVSVTAAFRADLNPIIQAQRRQNPCSGGGEDSRIRSAHHYGESGDYVFNGTDGRKPVFGWSKAQTRMLKACLAETGEIPKIRWAPQRRVLELWVKELTVEDPGNAAEGQIAA
jgi:hypothetical protein